MSANDPKRTLARPNVWNGPWSISTFAAWLTKVTFGKTGDRQSSTEPTCACPAQTSFAAFTHVCMEYLT
jgi:hypothetical protein